MENTAVVEYRAGLLKQLSESSTAFCGACRAAADPFKPLDQAGWNVHQLAAHVRDVEAQSYGLRVQRTLAEQYPLFPKFRAEVWAAGHYDPNEPLEKILSELENNVSRMLAGLRAQPESAWSRLGRHEIQGDRTLQIWVERSLEHIREHLATVRKAG